MFVNEEPESQICLNGHVTSLQWSPQSNQKFCTKCGEPTITACQQCKAAISGRYSGPPRSRYSALDPEYFQAPSFCPNCGESYPWTQRRLQAAKDLADELDELDEAERDKLKESLDDLAKDSPQTEVAVTRFKKIMSKLGTQSASALKSIVVDLVSETAKKMLFQ